MAVVYHAKLSTPWSRRDRPTTPWLNFVAKQRATPNFIRWMMAIYQCRYPAVPHAGNDNRSKVNEFQRIECTSRALPSFVVRKDRFLHFLRSKPETECSVCCSGVHMCNVLLLYFLHWLRKSTFRLNWVRWLGQRCRPSSMSFLAVWNCVNKNFISQRDMRADAIYACTNYSSKHRLEFFDSMLLSVAGAISLDR